MSIDANAVASDLYPALNAATAADLVFWTDAELFTFCQEAVQMAGRLTRVFMTAVNLEVAIIPGEIAVPGGTVAVTRAEWQNIALREATVSELEALDDAWTVAVGTPTRWTFDKGMGMLRLYPNPAAAGTLGLVLQGWPAVTQVNPAISACLPFAGFLRYAVLGAARGKVSDAQMPEIAAHSAERVLSYISLMSQMWGAGS